MLTYNAQMAVCDAREQEGCFLTFSPPERASICRHLFEGGMAVKLTPLRKGSSSLDVMLK